MLNFDSKVVFVKDPALWRHFTAGRTGAVGSDIQRRGRKLSFLAKQTVGKKTGRLAASIKSTWLPSRYASVKVGSDLRHAYMVHEGTRAHVIQADKRTTLKFMVGGKVVYATRIEHPGTKAQKYLTKHLHKVVND